MLSQINLIIQALMIMRKRRMKSMIIVWVSLKKMKCLLRKSLMQVHQIKSRRVIRVKKLIKV